jgi:hypothetical protein
MHRLPRRTHDKLFGMSLPSAEAVVWRFLLWAVRPALRQVTVSSTSPYCSGDGTPRFKKSTDSEIAN